MHHAKKGGSLKRPGQALRGSSDFHAWGDSNLYLSRIESQLVLTVEHRAEQACAPLRLELRSHNDDVHLEIAHQPASTPNVLPATAENQILNALTTSHQPLWIRALRDQVALRHETVSAVISDLTRRGIVRKTNSGYRLTGSAPV